MNKDVLLSEKPIIKIVISATRFANFGLLKEDWGEVYGLLQGKIEGENVIVTDAIPFTHTKKDESELFLKVGFGPEDYVAAAELSEKIAPEFFVGWYHSHPNIDLFLSDFDNETQLGYQNQNPDAIALVIDPFLIIKNLDLDINSLEFNNEKTFGFKIFRLEGPEINLESKFYEVKWQFQGDIGSTREKINSLIDKIPQFLPAQNLKARLEKFIELNNEKVKKQFYSLSDYINQIKKKDRKKRQEVFEKQYPDIKKFNDKLIEIIKTRIYFLDFVEYKEYNIRDEFIQRLNDLLSYVIEINNKLEKLKNEI
ncbi:MAG: hypothetical protein ACTSQO_09865 [Candidatus Helarchaeota archaeon]